MSAALLVILTALASWWGCKWLVGWLQASKVIDVPNHRSLHAAPVPRGGGLAIAGVVLLTQGVLVMVGLLNPVLGTGVVAVGLGFALLGWVDDVRSLSVSLRLAVQVLLAAVWVVFAVAPGDRGALLAIPVLAVVWHVNLFNFMDGADGIAGVQASAAAFGIAAMAAAQGEVALAAWALAIAGASCGFLFWNWAPARIFLGDTGSYFLGFELAALILIAHTSGIALSATMILIAPFVGDASLTLVQRIASGQRWWSAHRSHAYQLLILGGCSPRLVSGALAALLAMVLWPLAWLAAEGAHGAGATVSAYALVAIIWAAVKWRAAAGPEQS